MNARSSGLARTASGSSVAPPSRCSPRPSRAPSHPTPTAPGPNWSHISGGTTAVCSSVRVVPPSGAGASRTSTTDESSGVGGPMTHVSRRSRGASHARISPPALPSTW
ncbi:Uncharacterised protein [Mycobacteroides abscessus]|nr:Uncharacterised protein [Mycobacteroides abscessus]